MSFLLGSFIITEDASSLRRFLSSPSNEKSFLLLDQTFCLNFATISEDIFPQINPYTTRRRGESRQRPDCMCFGLWINRSVNKCRAANKKENLNCEFKDFSLCCLAGVGDEGSTVERELDLSPIIWLIPSIHNGRTNKKETTRQATLAKSKTIWFVFSWIKIIEMINSKHTENICSIDIKQENPKNVKIHKRIYGFECLDTRMEGEARMEDVGVRQKSVK